MYCNYITRSLHFCMNYFGGIAIKGFREVQYIFITQPNLLYCLGHCYKTVHNVNSQITHVNSNISFCDKLNWSF